MAEGYLNRGMARENLGDLDKACRDWKMAKELGMKKAEKYLKDCN